MLSALLLACPTPACSAQPPPPHTHQQQQQQQRVQAGREGAGRQAAMKLLTHNMLQSHVRGVKEGYPLKIEADKVEERPAPYDPDFLRHIYPRLQWAALLVHMSAVRKLHYSKA